MSAGLSVYSSNGGPRKLVSTHGSKLLKELSSPYIPTINNDDVLNRCIEYVNIDKNAGKLKNEHGNTAYHLLVGRDYDEDFILPLLKILIEKSPDAVKIKNDEGYLPLHLALASPLIFEEVATLLLKAYPESATMVNPEGLTPLLLSVMRDNSSFELCKLLCQLYSKGPQIPNKTRSLPLHFACKRSKPNISIIKMLLRRHPDAAKVVNNYGFLPLHCICMSTDDLDAVKIVYNAYPEGIEKADLAGKSCLHLAVLNIGKEHSNAVAKELEEIEAKKRRGDKNEQDDDDSYDDSDDDDDDNAANGISSMQERGKSRHVLQFLITTYPLALITVSSFNSTPVDTVVEKYKPLRTKKKEVTIYGLYDDPPTARLLLLSHHIYSIKLPNIFPPLKKDYRGMLKELNWICRKDAVYVSIVGDPRPSSSQYKLLKQCQESLSKASSSSTSTTSNVTTTKKNSKKHKNTKAPIIDDIADIENIFNKLTINEDDITKNNLLARLRKKGFLDLVKTIISYI